MSAFASTALLILQIVNSYYLSLNTFEFEVAENYCIQHCGSHIVSLHSFDDYDELKNLVINITYNDPIINIDPKINTWIGLNDIEINNKYEWIDGTKLDFLNDTVPEIGKYPFGPDEPGNDPCIIMEGKDGSGDYLFNDKPCYFTDIDDADEMIFACNHCNGVLTKYVILDDIKTTRNTQKQECEDIFGTGLASIHNNNDATDIHRLCNISTTQQIEGTGSDQSCFIGLYDNNLTDGMHYGFSWDDGTTFDFGNDVSGGIAPWDDQFNEPDATKTNSLCVELRKPVEFDWADTSCTNSRKAICNMPSEICYQHQWTVIYGESGVWNVRPCQLILMFNNINNNINMIIIGNKRWDNGDKMLVIEYMYTLNDIDSSSQGGIILHSDPVCHNYYFIGIDPYRSIVIVAEVWNGIYNVIETESLGFIYQIGIFYLLRIEIYGDYITVYVNNERLILMNNVLTQNADGISPYIGVSNNNSSVIAKYLFVSGSSVHESNDIITVNSWFEPCTLQPTGTPTSTPTQISTTKTYQKSTINCIQRNSAILTVLFNYTLTNTVTTIPEIERALSNVTDVFLKNEIDELTDCTISEYLLDIMLPDWSHNAIINASICFVCNDGDVLDIDFTANDLDKDFIETVEETTPILIVIANSTNIYVEIIKENEYVSSSTTLFEIDSTKNRNKSDDILDTILYVFIALLLCICCLCLGVVMYDRMKKKQKSEKNEANIKEGNHLMIIGRKIDANLTNIDSNSFVTEMRQQQNDNEEEGTSSVNPNDTHSGITDGNTLNDEHVIPGKHAIDIKGVDDEIIIDDEEDNITPEDENEGDTGGSDEMLRDNDDDDDERKYNTRQNGDIDKKMEERLMVKEWLEHVVGLSEYYQNFIENGYESMDFIKEIADNLELNEIGIMSKHHEIQIMNEIKKLRNGESDNMVIPYQGNDGLQFDGKYLHDIQDNDNAETVIGSDKTVTN